MKKKIGTKKNSMKCLNYSKMMILKHNPNPKWDLKNKNRDWTKENSKN